MSSHIPGPAHANGAGPIGHAKTPSLVELAKKHGTDKLQHGYLPFYERYLGPRRQEPLKLLEIGVGGYGEPTSGGESLRLWAEYLPNARIVGVDAHEKRLALPDRVTVLQGRQQDSAFLERLASEHGPFDVVIDDGSHVNSQRNASFFALFSALCPNGIYVLEDLHTSYWPDPFGGSFTNLQSSKTSIGMLKELIDGLHYEYVPGWEERRLDSQIVGVSFHSKIAFVEKGDNRHHRNILELAQIQRQTDTQDP